MLSEPEHNIGCQKVQQSSLEQRIPDSPHMIQSLCHSPDIIAIHVSQQAKYIERQERTGPAKTIFVSKPKVAFLGVVSSNPIFLWDLDTSLLALKKFSCTQVTHIQVQRYYLIVRHQANAKIRYIQRISAVLCYSLKRAI